MFVRDTFEWGADGDSVATSGGGVAWTVGASPPTISTDRAYRGTRSVKWTGSAIQWMQKGLTATTGYDISLRYWKESGGGQQKPIQHGNGTKRIRVTVTGAGAIGHYTDGGLVTHDAYSLEAWHWLQVKNINWTAYTFDLFVDGAMCAAGCAMETSAALTNLYQFTTDDSTSGKRFYMDDIVFGKVAHLSLPANKLVAARLI